jgi:F-type H+-transporting ATPase subunit b
MKWIKLTVSIFCWITAVAIGLQMFGATALAAEEAGNWRSIFDLVMRWVNFAILAFILIKYAKTPLKNFLGEKRQEIAHQINKIEQEKETAEHKIKETLKVLEDSKIRLVKMKQHIIENGEKKKQKIIAEARQESQILMESARKRIDNQFLEAQKTLKSELAEMAINLAVERLPAEITEEDNQKWVNAFLSSITSK